MLLANSRQVEEGGGAEMLKYESLKDIKMYIVLFVQNERTKGPWAHRSHEKYFQSTNTFAHDKFIELISSMYFRNFIIICF